jgi:hypothetical protein
MRWRKKLRGTPIAAFSSDQFSAREYLAERALLRCLPAMDSKRLAHSTQQQAKETT